MNKISSKEIFVIVLSLCISLFPTLGTSLIIDLGKNSTIISGLLGLIIGLIPIFMIIYISKFNIKENIFEFNIKNFNFFGHIINFLYILGIIYTGFIISWSIINFTISQLLIRTSYYFVAIVLFSILALCVMRGKEIIGRSTLVLFYFLVGLLLFSWGFLIPEVNISNLFPFFSESLKTTLTASLAFASFASFPIVTILCIKKDDIVDKKNYKKAVILAYIFGCIAVIMFLFLIISIYGYDLASLFSFPEYYVFKKINAFNFIQRVENILGIVIYIGVFGSLCFLIYFVRSYFINVFKIKKEKNINILVYILSIFVPLISIYFFKNYNIDFLVLKYPIFSSVIFIGLILNFIAVLLNKKKLSSS